jgi:hypothetical protein
MEIEKQMHYYKFFEDRVSQSSSNQDNSHDECGLGGQLPINGHVSGKAYRWVMDLVPRLSDSKHVDALLQNKKLNSTDDPQLLQTLFPPIIPIRSSNPINLPSKLSKYLTSFLLLGLLK